MTIARLRRIALWLVNRAAWLVPGAERRRWRAQWHADIWHRCDVLDRKGLLNRRTARVVLGRAAGAIWHAAWLRYRSGEFRMLIHDVRDAFRSLKGRPAFTAAAVLTLSLGIGANSVIFSWIEATLLDTMPGVSDSGSLAALNFTTATRDNLSLSYPNYLDIRDASVPGIAGIAAFNPGALSLRTAEGAERVWGEVVTGNMFALLGVNAAAGRLITPGDDVTPDGHPVVVLSHAFWQRRFGGRADMIGGTLTLNGRTFTVIGVTAPGFQGTQPMIALDLFLPMAMQKTFIPGDRLAQRGSGWLQGLVRLAPGATLAQAQAGLDVVAQRLAREHPALNEGRGLRLYELWRQPSGGTGMLLPVMALLGGLVALLLALVCANMASLFLARANGRQRELAVRRSLGASGGHVLRLLVVESLLLAVAAGAIGALVARWSGALLNAFLPPLPIPVAIEAGLNGPVLVFSALVSLVAGGLLGLVPGLQAMKAGDLMTPLKAGAGGNSAPWRRGRLRQGLIVVQVALALVLLVSAGLFIQVLAQARNLDPGFQARNGLVGAIDVMPAGYDAARGRQLFTRIAEELRALPGVEAAALGQRLPLTTMESSDTSVEIEGYTAAKGEELSVFYASVGVGYFDAIRMPLVEGRDFTARDTPDAPPVIVINETMARRYWAGRRSLGGRVNLGDRWAEVVGVVRDAKYSSMREAPRPFMYFPVDQVWRAATRIVVRTAGPPDALVAPIRQALQRIDPNLPLFDVQTIEQHIAFSFFAFEMVAVLLGVFGVTAALLSALGLYGVVAQSVTLRTREIGVRMSLGATAAEVRRMVLQQGLTLVAIGLALGLAATVGVSRLFASQLMGVSAYDPASYAVTTALLVATAAAACYLPARRAARLDPVQALRME
ncbi:MAG: ABC transporter permease [Vicinamibacterales bacterium]